MIKNMRVYILKFIFVVLVERIVFLSSVLGILVSSGFLGLFVNK